LRKKKKREKDAKVRFAGTHFSSIINGIRKLYSLATLYYCQNKIQAEIGEKI